VSSSRTAGPLTKALNGAHGYFVLFQAGLIDPLRPDRGVKALVATSKLGPIGGAAKNAAMNLPDRLGIVDELGSLTYAEIDRRTNALANALRAQGLGEGAMAAVLCRDHRGLVETLIACAKLGVRVLLMNTGFGGPQLAEVANREGVDALIYDQEFTGLLSAVRPEMPRFLGWVDDASTVDVPTLAELIAGGSDEKIKFPSKAAGVVLLTSGTTGTPKGASRQIKSPLAAAHFLERIPLKTAGCTFIASPMFHATGFANMGLALALGSTIVVRRRFDAEATLRMVQDYKANAIVMVPTQLSRVLDLGPEVHGKFDLTSVKILFFSGSALAPDLGNRAQELFGPCVYNLYGSTEVAVATVCTPEEWTKAPGTVGKPPHGTHVKLFDKAGNEVTTPNTKGRIFVGSDLAFGGYTGGGTKDSINGLLSSGDVGHFNEDGLLFIDGRDDDMIVSGGENVFPGEIEDLLIGHEDVAEAAVIGVPDPDFGERLRAFVVPAEGAHLNVDLVKEYVRTNLARHKVPRDVVFMDELPRNPTGKLLRRKLAELD
jgi:fatty-acyl-CoA synthase